MQVSYQLLLFSAEDINLQRHDLPVTKACSFLTPELAFAGIVIHCQLYFWLGGYLIVSTEKKKKTQPKD